MHFTSERFQKRFRPRVCTSTERFSFNRFSGGGGGAGRRSAVPKAAVNRPFRIRAFFMEEKHGYAIVRATPDWRWRGPAVAHDHRRDDFAGSPIHAEAEWKKQVSIPATDSLSK